MGPSISPIPPTSPTAAPSSTSLSYSTSLSCAFQVDLKPMGQRYLELWNESREYSILPSERTESGPIFIGR
eukprot:3634375-Rhodomonas_salina.1